MQFSLIKSVLLGVGLYLLLFFIEQFSGLPQYLNWYVANLLIFLVVVWNVIYWTGGTLRTQIFTAVGTAFAGFILCFLYSNLAHWQANRMCYAKIVEKYGCIPGRGSGVSCSAINGDIVETNGYKKSWNDTLKCESTILPFPWGKQPRLQ